MSLINKIKWIAGILLIFIIILTTNLIDKDNFNRLRYSVTTIYEDRIVASDLIFEITILIQEKEMALATEDSLFFTTRNDKINQDIQRFIARYEETKLTSIEEEIFNNLKGEIQNLTGLERKYIGASLQNNTDLFESIDDIIHHLYDLSKVQLKEGRREMLMSNKTMETIDLFTQVEIIFLIFMAVLVQIIILYKL